MEKYTEELELNLLECEWSEKLDGVYAYWDGIELVSKTGKPFSPPPEFREQLPARKCAGEIWAGRGNFETVRQAVQTNSEDWSGVIFVPHGSIMRKPIVIDLTSILSRIESKGGEGVVIHCEGRDYKLKPIHDADAIVLEHHKNGSGQVTSLTALDRDRHRFRLNLSRREDLLKSPPPVGCVVEYQYSGRTAKGKPKFPVIIRQRAEEQFTCWEPENEK